MHRTTAAVLIALAFTAGNIAAPSADVLRVKPAQQKLQLQAPQTQGVPAAPQNLQAQPFPANCVAGFQKFDQKMATKAGVPVVASFKCRTAWIECPNFPAFAETWSDIEVQDQGTGDAGKRYRVIYSCMGYDPEG